MARFLLDTDSVSYALRGEGNVGAHLSQHRPSEIAISSITLAELRFGAEKRHSKKLNSLIDAFARAVAVLSFDEDAAAAFGAIAVKLRNSGTPIGEFDTLIAAHALSQRLTLVTNNTRHFTRIAGLKVENWV
jgi:tRNA(fMet)-specific endonuclease VapC